MNTKYSLGLRIWFSKLPISDYENEKQVGENFIDCSDGRQEQPLTKVCRFDVNTLGDNCTWQKDYGYDEGQPCVLVKLNRVSFDHYQVYSVNHSRAPQSRLYLDLFNFRTELSTGKTTALFLFRNPPRQTSCIPGKGKKASIN